MAISLNNPLKVVLQPEKSVTVSELKISRVVDIPGQKIVRCFVEQLEEPIVLWEGAAYDSIGQWTDSDVTTRLNQLYNS
jgi:hypothetical protein